MQACTQAGNSISRQIGDWQSGGRQAGRQICRQIGRQAVRRQTGRQADMLANRQAGFLIQIRILINSSFSSPSS